MRITFLTNKFGPNFIGGADKYTFGIASELQSQDCIVSVGATERIDDLSVPPGMVHYEDRPYGGLDVRRFSFDWRSMDDPYASVVSINSALEQALVEFLEIVKPDIVHVTEFDRITAAAIAAPAALGIPTIVTLCGRWMLCPSGTLLQHGQSLCSGLKDGLTCADCMFGKTRFLKTLNTAPRIMREQLIRLVAQSPLAFRNIGSLNLAQAVEQRNKQLRQLYETVERFITPSDCFYELYTNSGLIPRAQIIKCEHGHKTADLQQAREKSPSEKIRFGYIGNVVGAKGVHVLIEAFGLLADQEIAELDIHGSLTDADYAEQLMSSAMGMPNIRFHGHYQHDELPEILRNIDVVVVPSLWIENSPLTIAEAHASMTPVIGSRVCGVEEWIRHGVNGFTFPRGNAHALADHMQSLISKPDLLTAFRSAIPNVRTLGEEAEELKSIYSEVRNK